MRWRGAAGYPAPVGVTVLEGGCSRASVVVELRRRSPRHVAQPVLTQCRARCCSRARQAMQPPPARRCRARMSHSPAPHRRRLGRRPATPSPPSRTGATDARMRRATRLGDRRHDRRRGRRRPPSPGARGSRRRRCSNAVSRCDEDARRGRRRAGVTDPEEAIPSDHGARCRPAAGEDRDDPAGRVAVTRTVRVDETLPRRANEVSLKRRRQAARRRGTIRAVGLAGAAMSPHARHEQAAAGSHDRPSEAVVTLTTTPLTPLVSDRDDLPDPWARAQTSVEPPGCDCRPT